MLYRIFWKKENGTTGQGDPIDKISAQAWVKKLNKEHPNITHWIVPAEDTQ